MNAIAIASPVLALLRQHGYVVTEVHSVFTHACNLISPYGMLSLLSPEKSMNPMGIKLSETDSLVPLSVGNQVVIVEASRHHSDRTGEAPHCWQVMCDSRRMTTFSPRLPHYEPLPLQLERQLSQYLTRHAKTAGIFPLLRRCSVLHLSGDVDYYSELMADYFTPYLLAFVEELTARSPSLSLARFIGFGAGLTPSSDDLLVGILAYLSYVRHDYFDVIAAACLPCLKQTTEVSQAMLQLAVKRQFNEDIVRFFHHIHDDNQRWQALDSMLEYGHSSGHDTACGIYLAMVLFQ